MNVSKIHTTNASLKYFLITVVIISLMLLSMPARAETGTITLPNTSTLDFTGVASGNRASFNITFHNFSVDVRNFSQLDTFDLNWSTGAITNPNVNFVGGYNQTTFTISQCGSGTGVAIKSQATLRFVWYFNKPNHIDCSPIVLTYAQEIFDTNNFYLRNGIGAQYVGRDTSSYLVDNNQPILPFIYAPGTTNNKDMVIGGTLVGGGFPIVAHEVLDTNAIINYNITYPHAGTFVTSIDKSPTNISTIVKIQNVSGSPIPYPNQNDTTFNNYNYSIDNNYYNGIALNLQIPGNSLLTVINTTGVSSGPSQGNASNPNAANCVGYNCITTSKPTYNNTESANIYGSFYPATTTITDCLFFGFICTDKTISTESTTGYVFISTMGSTSPIRFISFTPDLHNNFNLYTDLDIGTYQAQLFGFAGPGTTCTSGIVYDFPFVPLGCYYPHNITSFNVVNASGNLSIHWQTKISNNTAIYGDTITVAWSNVTPNDTVVIYDNDGVISQSYNINQSTVSQIPVFIPLYTIGQWRATIFNSSNVLHNVTAYLNVVPPGSVDVNNSFGITMYWSKAADVINNPTLLNWNTGTYTGNYNISILQNGNEIRRTSYFGVPGQTQQGSYTFGEQGAYVAQFLDSPNETVQAQADIFISAATSSGGGTGGTTANQSSNNIVGSESQILTLPWIGLMILIVVIFGLWKNNVNTGFSVFVIALTTSIEAVIGLWQQWGIYITILSWLLVGVFFKLNKTIEE